MPIEKPMFFAEAYKSFPEFQKSFDEHSPAKNKDKWLAQELFFVFCARNGRLGKWLGREGPKIDKEIWDFFNTCDAYSSGLLRHKNNGNEQNPVAYYRDPSSSRGFFRIHLETDKPEILLKMCMDRMPPDNIDR